jgi:alkylhydroperoxidase/carboxymuconolactone decarboxylase family protein YurZ
MSNIHEAHKRLIARILEGDGQAPHAQRRAAFANAGLPEPLRTLVEKVAVQATAVTDHDVQAALAAGLSEDQLFEVVVCAAVGQATRQYEAAWAALESASQQE